MPEDIPIVQKAVAAIREAVRKAVEEQRRLGLDVPVWKDGKIVFLNPESPSDVRETTAAYRTRRQR